jgi:hypothetical protein
MTSTIAINRVVSPRHLSFSFTDLADPNHPILTSETYTGWIGVNFQGGRRPCLQRDHRVFPAARE